MSFQEFVSTTASIVAIVGGVIAIYSTFSKVPVFSRFWQRQATSETLPVRKATPSSGAQKQTRQILATNRLKLALIYGVMSGVLSVLTLLGGIALSQQT